MYATKFLTRGLAAGVVCAVVAGNVQAADLKVGLSVSLSGPNSSLGVPYSKGMQAALAYKGQTGGHKIQLVVLDDASDPTVATTTPGADTLAIIRSRHDQLLAALDSLPERQREVLTLRYWNDLTETEIADALGISQGSVKTHAHRALAALAAGREELT